MADRARRQTFRGRDPRIGRRRTMDGIIYLVGLIVIIMFILSFFGLR